MQWQSEHCEPLALFTYRQLQTVLAQPPFDQFDVSDLTLVVVDKAEPGAWYDPADRRLSVNWALYRFALLILTKTTIEGEENLFHDVARSFDLLLMRMGRARSHHVHGDDTDLFINGYRVTRFETFTSSFIQEHSWLHERARQFAFFLGPKGQSINYSLKFMPDTLVDIARIFFLFICLHEVGHHVYRHADDRTSTIYERAAQGAAESAGESAFAGADLERLVEERYADAFAMIGCILCREKAVSAEQLLFARSLYEFLIGVLFDTVVFLYELTVGHPPQYNRLLHFHRFKDLKSLQIETLSALELWEQTVVRTATFYEHRQTLNSDYRFAHFDGFARLHTDWLKHCRGEIEREGQRKGPNALVPL